MYKIDRRGTGMRILCRGRKVREKGGEGTGDNNTRYVLDRKQKKKEKKHVRQKSMPACLKNREGEKPSC